MEEFENYKKGLKFDDFGDVINESIEIYKKTALMSGIGFIILSIITGILITIGVKFYVNVDNIEDALKNFNPDKLSTQGRIIYMAVSLGFAVLISPFIAGLLKMAKDASENREVKLSTFYSVVNSKYFIQIILFSVLTHLTAEGLQMLFHLSFGNFGKFLGILSVFAFSTLTFIGMPLILFSENNFFDAFKNSIIKTGSCFGTVILLLIVSYIFVILGIIGLCIGIFFTMPFIYAMQYVIYKRLS
jgi:hypothetical protein